MMKFLKLSQRAVLYFIKAGISKAMVLSTRFAARMEPLSITDVLKNVLFCLLIFTNAVETADPALENDFPPHWQQVPRDLEAFGKKDNHPVIDPWTYLDRMGMYKTLLSATHKNFATLGLNETHNVLWGLPLVLAWQFVTGRLADPSKNTNGGDKSGDLYFISPSSWWACFSYYLSAVPFLVAAEAGIFENWQDETEILPPKEFSNDFCSTYDSCHLSLSFAMDKWKLYFEKLIATTPVSDVPSAVDQLEFYMWQAHEVSIESALPICRNRFQFLPEPEADFDENLAKGVHFIGATRFVTDYETMKKFQSNLPPRILRDNDKCPLILDFTTEQNIVCQMLKRLRDYTMYAGGYLLQLWKNAMCSPEGRKVCETILESMFEGKMYTMPGLVHMLEPYEFKKVCITDLNDQDDLDE